MIQLTDNLLDAGVRLSQGNPGALHVICEIIKKPDGWISLLDLDDMGLKGSSIWLGFKEHCGQDLDKFIECLRSRDKDMIATIESNGGYAVAHGAS